MPEAPRIGVIGLFPHWEEWRRRVQLPIDSAWHLMILRDIDLLREWNARLLSIVCLRGWESVPDCLGILAGAQSLLLPPPRRGAVEETDDEAFSETGSERPVTTTPERPAPLGPDATNRDIALAYARENFPGLGSASQLDGISITSLLELRRASMQLLGARLGGNDSRIAQYQDLLNVVIRDIREEMNSSRPPVPWVGRDGRVVPAQAPIRAPALATHPVGFPPVGDVLRRSMRDAEEAARAVEETPPRRRRTARPDPDNV